MVTLITLAIMGWVINLILGIKTIMDGWRRRDQGAFEVGVGVTAVGLIFGLVLGWVLLFKVIKRNYINEHFNNDKPKRVKG